MTDFSEADCVSILQCGWLHFDSFVSTEMLSFDIDSTHWLQSSTVVVSVEAVKLKKLS